MARHGRRLVGPAVALLAALLALTSFIVQASYSEYYQARYRPLRMGTQVEIVWPDDIVRCSLGLPMYKDLYVTVPISPPFTLHLRVYGVATASHCGDYGDAVHQNEYDPSGANYIGSIVIDGRYGRGGELRNSTLPDAAFIAVEVKPCSDYCPGPDVVSVYIQHGAGLAILEDKVRDYEGLRSLLGEEVYKGGRTTGLTSGLVVALAGFDLVDIAQAGPVVLATYSSSPGDSGGIVYRKVRLGFDTTYIAVGVHIGRIEVDSIDLAVAVPVYVIEDALGIQTYLGGG